MPLFNSYLKQKPGVTLSSDILGTANQITVTDNGDDTVTLSLPQDYDTGAEPTLGKLIITSDTEPQLTVRRTGDGYTGILLERAYAGKWDWYIRNEGNLEIHGGDGAGSAPDDVHLRINASGNLDVLYGASIWNGLGVSGNISTDSITIEDGQTGDSWYWIGTDSNDNAADDDNFMIGKGNTVGTTPYLTIAPAGAASFVGTITSTNYTAVNLLTACATNAGALDFSAASKTLTVEDSAIVSQDYTSDASPEFASLTLSGTVNVGLDFSGGTWATANINLAADPIIQAAGTQILHSDATNSNLIIGNGAGANVTLNTAKYNTLLGDNAGQALTEGLNNVLIGHEAGYSLTTLDYIVAIGRGALYAATSGEARNVVIGYEAGYYLNSAGGSSGQKNIYLGTYCGKGSGATNTGYQNIAIGDAALTNVTSGYRNFALGANSLWSNTSGYGNIAVGGDSMYSNTEGNYNVAIGYLALRTPTSADFNVAIGAESMRYTSSGYSNVGIGYFSLTKNTTGYKGVGIGYEAMKENLAGNNNVAIGWIALKNNQNGDENVIIGDRTAGEGSGGTQADLSRNVCIGSQSAYKMSNGAANNIFIGYKSGYNQTTGSDLLIIDNQDRGSAANEATKSLIYGLFDADPANQYVKINGDLYLDADDRKIIMGGGDDGEIFYRNTAPQGIVISPRVVGTGGVVIGVGAAGVDYSLIFDGETNDFTITYMEDEDRLDFDGPIAITSIKSGSTQANAGAAANEVWKTSSHATLPDNVLMIGV